MSAVNALPAKTRAKRRKKTHDLTAESKDDEIIAAFIDAVIVSGPPILPANLPAAIALNRRLLECAMSIVEACRLGSDSMLAPIQCLPGRPSNDDPDFTGALTVVYRIINSIAANHALMAQIFPPKIGKHL